MESGPRRGANPSVTLQQTGVCLDVKHEALVLRPLCADESRQLLWDPDGGCGGCLRTKAGRRNAWGSAARPRRANQRRRGPYDSRLLTGRPCASPARPPSFSLETDTIDPHRTSSLNLSTLPPSSESPVPGPLNFSLDSSSSSSPSINILPFDTTSFTTDNYQQQWPPTPPPSQPPAYLNNLSANNSPSPVQEDFVLYPQRPQPRPRDSRPQAPANATLRQAAYQNFLVRSGHLYRRPSQSLQQLQQQQQLSSPPVQVPQVTRGASQSTGSLSSSLRSSPYSRKDNFLRAHAASVASNSAPAVRSYRPPVPNFNDSTTTNQFYYQKKQEQQQQPVYRVMSAPTVAHDLPDLFDFPSDNFGEEFVPSTEPAMTSPLKYAAGPVGGADADAPTTISPKDLLMDASAPPSTSFTDLSTPSFESPGYFSQDASPMFATDIELGPGHEEWDSLFPQDGFSGFDATSLDVAAALTQPPKAQPKAQPKAEPKAESPVSPVIQTTESVAPSPSPSGRGVSKKPSNVAGVNGRQRKPLPVIKYDSSDPIAAKRARNTEAARKSRARKMERTEVMERRIAELEQDLEQAYQREQYWKALAQNKA